MGMIIIIIKTMSKYLLVYSNKVMLMIIEINIEVPKLLTLQQNYPNPFNPSTEIHYSLPYDANVNLSVFDVSGRSIITLVQEKQSAGNKAVKWDGRDKNGFKVVSGLYLYRLNADYWNNQAHFQEEGRLLKTLFCKQVTTIVRDSRYPSSKWGLGEGSRPPD